MEESVPVDQKITPTEMIPTQFIIRDAIDIMHRLGLLATKHASSIQAKKKDKLLRYILSIVYILNFLHHSHFVFMYLTMDEDQIKKNERLFIMLGEFTYFIPEIRIHWNIQLMMYFGGVAALHYSYVRISSKARNEWADLLDFLTGEIKPQDFGLHDIHDIEKILKRLVPFNFVEIDQLIENLFN